MRKVMMIGKIGCGKTTLCQRLTGQEIRYQKTQTIQIVGDDIMDTPGEYFENKQFYKALIISAVEADVILLLYSVDQEQNTFSPGMNTLFGGKPLIGVITKTDLCADGERLAAIRDILSAAGASEIVETGVGDGESLDALRCLIEAQEI